MVTKDKYILAVGQGLLCEFQNADGVVGYFKTEVLVYDSFPLLPLCYSRKSKSLPYSI